MAKNKRFLLFFVLVATTGLSGCANHASSSLTSLQRRVMESKELEGTYEDAFRAATTVFQDKGYMIKTSDYVGGMLYAESNRGLCVFMKGCYGYKATTNFEKFTENRTKIRISIWRDVFDPAGNLWNNPGHGNPGTGPVQEPEMYQDFYAEIQKEMFRRAQLNK